MIIECCFKRQDENGIEIPIGSVRHQWFRSTES
jgi:hypothetical protein